MTFYQSYNCHLYGNESRGYVRAPTSSWQCEVMTTADGCRSPTPVTGTQSPTVHSYCLQHFSIQTGNLYDCHTTCNLKQLTCVSVPSVFYNSTYSNASNFMMCILQPLQCPFILDNSLTTSATELSHCCLSLSANQLCKV